MSSEEDFSQRVRRYREREGISQEELAKRLGMSRNYVSMIEGGRAPSDQVVRHFDLLEGVPELKEPADTASPVVKETPPNYDLMKKVIFIEEEGTPEQLALLDSFLDTVCEKLRSPRRSPSKAESGKPDRSPDTSE